MSDARLSNWTGCVLLFFSVLYFYFQSQLMLIIHEWYNASSIYAFASNNTPKVLIVLLLLRVLQATELEASDKTLDLSKGGIWQLPRTISVFPAVEELLLGQNQLTDEENNLQTLHAWVNMRLYCIV